MSGLWGYVGLAAPGTLQRLGERISYRGDRSDQCELPGVGLGYRGWQGRHGESAAIYRSNSDLVVCAGTLTPIVADPAAELHARLAIAHQELNTLDGAFAAAWWDGLRQRLTLLRDPFGVRSLYYFEHADTLYFATELKQLLRVPGVPWELDEAAIHKYLTFSFVPGEELPVRGIRRLLPGRVAVWEPQRPADQRWTITPYFELREEITAAMQEQVRAVRAVRQACQQAVQQRLAGESTVGLYLSGGLDSSGIAHWLRRQGVKVQALSLDFGTQTSESDQSDAVARHLDIPLDYVQVSGETLAPMLADLAWKLDLPYGDPVTGPQYLLGQTASGMGLKTVFNGEGGDQFFGGWTNKPMVSAQIYADLYESQSREETYLRSYHRFYGLEKQLYTEAFYARVCLPGQRRALLQPLVHSSAAKTFLNRMRLADIELKGSQNILPRMEQMASAWGLTVCAPLFDRRLATLSFQIPPQLKLHGACEKYVLKLALQRRLPAEVVWQKKLGMSVPITDWVLGALQGVLQDYLGAESLARRGWFRTAYVKQLLAGQNHPQETRRRRIGERLWTLVMLELWLRTIWDQRGRS
ncbi:MAG: asparagine synthetase B family protein [Planctomycetota bacterium]